MLPDIQPMNAAELMDRVFDVYKRSFIKQVAFSALVRFISVILFIIFGAGVTVFLVLMYTMGDLPEEMIIVLIIVAILILLPFYMIFIATLEAGHILYSRQAFCGQYVKLPLKNITHIILRVISVTITQLILLIPFILVFFFFFTIAIVICFLINPDAMNNFINNPDLMNNNFVLFLLIGFSLLFVLIYVVYSNVYALSIPVAVFEKRSFFGTVKRSWQLIKGEYWKILGLRMMWFVIIYIFTYSAQGIWATINAFIPFSFGLEMVGSLLSSMVSLLITFIVAPLASIFPAVIYFNQRIKKEGMDIEMGIERINGV